MCDYQAMYYMLAGKVADALEMLEEALLEAEDMYIREQETKSILRSYPQEQDEPSRVQGEGCG